MRKTRRKALARIFAAIERRRHHDTWAGFRQFKRAWLLRLPFAWASYDGKTGRPHPEVTETR